MPLPALSIVFVKPIVVVFDSSVSERYICKPKLSFVALKDFDGEEAARNSACSIVKCYIFDNM